MSREIKIDFEIGRLSMSWGCREMPYQPTTRGNSEHYYSQGDKCLVDGVGRNPMMMFKPSGGGDTVLSLSQTLTLILTIQNEWLNLMFNPYPKP